MIVVFCCCLLRRFVEVCKWQQCNQEIKIRFIFDDLIKFMNWFLCRIMLKKYQFVFELFLIELQFCVFMCYVVFKVIVEYCKFVGNLWRFLFCYYCFILFLFYLSVVIVLILCLFCIVCNIFICVYIRELKFFCYDFKSQDGGLMVS